jgi:hypothetical protein
MGQKKQLAAEDLLRKIKDLFYSSKKTIYEIFQEAKTGSSVDAQGLRQIVQKLSNNTVSDE